MFNTDIALYVHIPFCKAKCNYCDFNSFAGKERQIPEYFNALKREIGIITKERKDQAVRTIFIGGGTPSIVDSELIQGLMSELFNQFKILPESEITIESNPGTLTEEKLNAYRRFGINRLSIGLQAWQDNHLKSLGRIHSSKEFENNYIAAKRAGFENINIDLMFGLPGQTLQDWKETMERVVALNPQHLSCYSLKIEEGTLFGDLKESGELIQVEDELDREMYRLAIEELGKADFIHYEISNFSKKGFQCEHNLVYWKAKEYIGLGAGAHSYMNDQRYRNVDTVEEYIKAISKGEIPMQDVETISENESMAEYMILGLRLTEGVRYLDFKKRYSRELSEVFGPQVEKLLAIKLLEEIDGRLQLTLKGLDLANQVFQEFL